MDYRKMGWFSCSLVAVLVTLTALAQGDSHVDDAFRTVDLDVDGKLSPAEYALASLGESRMDDETAKIFSGLDANQDGFIQKHEFALGTERVKEMIRLKARDIFEKSDVNRDGWGSKAEYAIAVSRPLNAEELMIWRALDVNGDGMLTRTEVDMVVSFLFRRSA